MGELVRYADDFVILCRSRVEAETAAPPPGCWLTPEVCGSAAVIAEAA
jgi:hypothetical protein